MLSYWLSLASSKNFAQAEIERYFSSYPAEKDLILNHPSRVETSAALSSLVVCKAAGVKPKKWEEALTIAGLQRVAAKLSSIRDEWLDEVYRVELSQNGHIPLSFLKEQIGDESWRPEKILEREIFLGKNGSKYHQKLYFNASALLQTLYRSGLERYGEHVLQVYRMRKRQAEFFQAEDLMLSATLLDTRDGANASRERILKTAGIRSYEEGVRASIRLADKLGIVGGALPEITYKAVGGQDKQIEFELFTFGRTLAKLSQILFDDVPSFKSDIRTRNPNLIALAVLSESPIYENPLLLQQHRSILSNLLTPLVEQLGSSVETLEGLNFAGSDARKVSRLTLREGTKRTKALAKDLRIDFKEDWIEARQL